MQYACLSAEEMGRSERDVRFKPGGGVDPGKPDEEEETEDITGKRSVDWVFYWSR